MWGLLLEMDNMRAGWHWAVRQARFAEIVRYTDQFNVHCGQGWYQEAISSLAWAADVLRTHCADGVSREGSVALALILIRQGYMYQAYDPGRRIERRDRLVGEGVSILRRLGAWRELARTASWVAYAYSPERDAEAWQVLQESLTAYRELGDLEGVSNLLPVLGELAVRRRAYDEAERYCQEALSLGEKIDYGGAIDYTSHDLAKIAYHRGEYPSARHFFEDALARAEKGGHKIYAGMYCTFLGDAVLAMGDYEQARERYEQARALYEEMSVPWGEVASGEHYGVAYSLNRLGDIALAGGEIGRARACYRKALQIARDHPQVALNLDVVVSQAALLVAEGQEEQAVELAALALYHPKSHVEVTRRAQGLLDQLADELAPDVFAAARERGRARDLEATMVELFAELSE
jgi:tetratricopeptide (TPR) repeat protein